MKKLYNVSMISILLLLIVGTLLTGCGLHISFGNGLNLSKEDAMEFSVAKEAVEPITSIQIQTRIADVELIEADDFFVEIDYLYWEEAPEYSLENGKLTFNDYRCFPHSYSINFNIHNIIKIYLPKNSELKDLYVSNSSGDVSLAGFITDTLDATISYGDFSMEDAVAYKADITLSSGTSKISDVELGDLKFTNSYGDAQFTNINTGDAMMLSDISYDSLDISMSSGDVRIKNLFAYSVEIDNSYGNVTCEEIKAEEFDAALSSGELVIRSADLVNTDISNSYGNVVLSLKGPESDYMMDLDNSYGSIVVAGKDYEDHYESLEAGHRELSVDLSSGDVKISFKD